MLDPRRGGWDSDPVAEAVDVNARDHGGRPWSFARAARSAVWVLTISGGVAVVVLAALMVARLNDPRASVDLTTGVEPAAYLALTPDEVREVTDSICPLREGCVQAAQSDRVRIVRFTDPDDARREASRLAPYAWPSDHLLVEFLDPASMTPEEFQYVEQLVDGAGERALPLVPSPTESTPPADGD